MRVKRFSTMYDSNKEKLFSDRSEDLDNISTFNDKICVELLKMTEMYDFDGGRNLDHWMEMLINTFFDKILNAKSLMENGFRPQLGFMKIDQKNVGRQVGYDFVSKYITMTPENYVTYVHNFAAIEMHYDEKVIVHRKGAAKAEAGKLIAIPGSQGTKSYIVEGLGNSESFMSSSHGAGRKLSRGAAVHQLSLEEEQKKLEELGIVHSLRYQKDLEEAAGAYKDINEVLKKEEDLVKPIVELSPIAVIKGI